MSFTHWADPSRTATLTVVGQTPGVVEVEHTDAKGKRRKKTFKNAMLGRAHDAALRFLLNKERYVLRSPQLGAIQWLTRLMQDYRGTIGHAVDPETGAVWIADAIDHVHRVTPGSLETAEISLGSGHTSPSCLAAAGPGGRGYVLAISWERRGQELVRIFRLVCVRPDGDGLAIDERVRVVGERCMGSLACDVHGRVLGPAASGAALYAPDGAVLDEFPLDPTHDDDHAINPIGALAPGGEWLAFASAGGFERVHLPTGERRPLAGQFQRRMGLQIDDRGTIYVSGLLYPNYGVFALDEDGGEPRRVSTSISARVSADGRSLVEAEHDVVTLRDLSRPNEDYLPVVTRSGRFPVLGMAKTGQAVFGRPGELVVLTDAYTIAGVAIDEIPAS